MTEEIVKNWLKKAENDLKIGKDELATNEPATDMICFHMQQCVEKYLKAFLILHNKDFPRTHNIAVLINLCAEINETFQKLYEMRADELTKYAIDVRYSDEFYIPTLEEANECLKMATEAKNFISEKLKDKGFKGI